MVAASGDPSLSVDGVLGLDNVFSSTGVGGVCGCGVTAVVLIVRRVGGVFVICSVLVGGDGVAITIGSSPVVLFGCCCCSFFLPLRGTLP